VFHTKSPMKNIPSQCLAAKHDKLKGIAKLTSLQSAPKFTNYLQYILIPVNSSLANGQLSTIQ